jgi:pSer/pThr/pTyr-binding forkhead associated (FHA) protein
MLEVILTYQNEEGSQQIVLEEGKITFGRGSDADYRFNDNGLSRLHASIHREGDNVWILDENSTNGTFVNGEKVRPGGTPLRHGDEILIGNRTVIKVKAFSKEKATSQKAKAVGTSADSLPMMMTLGVAALALLVISVSAVIIGVKVFENDTHQVTSQTPLDEREEEFTETPDKDNRNANASPIPLVSSENSPSSKSGPEKIGNTVVETKNDGTQVTIPQIKYQQMSDDEKRRYIAVKAEKIARIIGNQKSDPIPPEAVQSIKGFLDSYVNRLNKTKVDDCSQGGWLRSDFLSVLQRASRTSPFIVRSFRAEGLEPQIGIYLAMVEGEHCPCLTSPTKAKGMFQFLASTWNDYDPEKNPENRCVPEKSAKYGAQYMKVLISRYGTAPDSILLAVASFNSGQGNLSKNLDKALTQAAGQNRSFWTLAARKDILEGKAGEQFRGENIKYVPKFFAAAIIGENPQDFGVNLQPLSTYTQ